MAPKRARGLQKQDVLSTPRYQGLLPRCEGPKLGPFHDRKAAIEFVRLLDDPQVADSEVTEGGQSHVFEVLIASRSYALKIVS